MSNKGKAVPRIAGRLNCGTDNFPVEPGPCQEEDRGPDDRLWAALRAGGAWEAGGGGSGARPPVRNASSDANQPWDLKQGA